MLIHKINPAEKYMDFELNSRFISDRLCNLVGATTGLYIRNFNIEIYEAEENWTIIQVKTINSKLIKSMYGVD